MHVLPTVMFSLFHQKRFSEANYLVLGSLVFLCLKRADSVSSKPSKPRLVFLPQDTVLKCKTYSSIINPLFLEVRKSTRCWSDAMMHRIIAGPVEISSRLLFQ